MDRPTCLKKICAAHYKAGHPLKTGPISMVSPSICFICSESHIGSRDAVSIYRDDMLFVATIHTTCLGDMLTPYLISPARKCLAEICEAYKEIGSNIEEGEGRGECFVCNKMGRTRITVDGIFLAYICAKCQ